MKRNILMVTNTYTPHVGGVARSVAGFARAYRQRGHRVLIIAPEFDGYDRSESGVVRVRAVQNFNGSDFSVVLATPPHVARAVNAFGPDIVHSHHPFLLGATALRLARSRHVPLVFTHHTLYEHYTHYVPGDSAALRRFVVSLSTNYANLADEVFAPSESVAALLRTRRVTAPVRVVPGGVDLEAYRSGSGSGFRRVWGIPDDAPVIGHVGRLAEEKNLGFLGSAIAAALTLRPDAYALIVGEGPAQATLVARFGAAGVAGRVVFTGTLQSTLLVSAYKALDAFAFASLTETQGLVLAEAMAAGVPVVALDASGVREIVHDGTNGRLLARADPDAFGRLLAETAGGGTGRIESLRRGARATAEAFSLDNFAGLALEAYESLIGSPARTARAGDEDRRVARLVRAELDWMAAAMGAASRALQRSPTEALETEGAGRG